MTKIRNASYRVNGVHKAHVSVEYIYQIRGKSQEEFEGKYKYSLFCPNLNCEAILRHHQPRNGIGSQYYASKKLKKNKSIKEKDHIKGECEQRQRYHKGNLSYLMNA